ncbi:unnamed protein product [Amoebophrya sp. A120]|nr:unnamed protein product [Amoebophrya sp. A120]|eukprot:GSA120T00020490001.1
MPSAVSKGAEVSGADWWNDSCSSAELNEAVSKGAVGSTSNPVILVQVLNAEKEKWVPKIDELISKFPSDTEAEIADRVNEMVVAEACEILKPVHKRENGKKGYLSAQVNPQLYRSTEKMVEQGVFLANAGGADTNVMIKAPALPAGLAAMEELTYKGISINATVSFTVSQAVKAAEAVERGLKRREAEGLPVDKMGPVITVMVGRVDDALRKFVDSKKVTCDPGHLNWGGAAVFKKVWKLFKEKNLRATPLAAAYRCVFHWSEILGENVVTSMPYRWWKQFDESDVEPRRSIEEDVPSEVMQTLTKLPLFGQFYDENLPESEFMKLQPTKDTLTQFLTARDDLLKIVRVRFLA